MKTKVRTLAILALVGIFALLSVACGAAGTATPTSTPMPPPTVVREPTPTPQPIVEPTEQAAEEENDAVAATVTTLDGRSWDIWFEVVDSPFFVPGEKILVVRNSPLGRDLLVALFDSASGKVLDDGINGYGIREVWEKEGLGDLFDYLYPLATGTDEEYQQFIAEGQNFVDQLVPHSNP